MKKLLYLTIILAVIFGGYWLWEKSAKMPVTEIKFISPTTGEVWKIGEPKEIKFNQIIEDAPVVLFDDADVYKGIAVCPIRGRDSVTWYVAGTWTDGCGTDFGGGRATPGNYKLKLLGAEQKVLAESPVFTLK